MIDSAPRSLPAASAMAPLRVEFVTTLAQLEPLGARWEELNRALSDHDAPFFQSFAWNYHVARVRLQRSARRYRLLVALLHRGEEIVGIWPLSLQRSAGAWVARSLDAPFGQFAGVLFARREDVDAGIAAVLCALRTQTPADALQIEAVLAASALHQALAAAGAHTRETNQAVYVDLRPHAGVTAFRQSVNAKTRKNLRNLRNRLQRTHGAQEQVIDSERELQPMIDATLTARAQWLDRLGRSSAAFRDADFRAILSSITVAGGVNLLGFSLNAEDTFAAAQWGFVYLERYYAYISARNPKFDPFSPGRMHLGMVIESCMARGIKVLELMPPASDYKLSWSERTRRLDSASMPFTFKGRLALEIAGHLMPTTQKLSRALPEGLRSSLARLVNRTR